MSYTIITPTLAEIAHEAAIEYNKTQTDYSRIIKMINIVSNLGSFQLTLNKEGYNQYRLKGFTTLEGVEYQTDKFYFDTDLTEKLINDGFLIEVGDCTTQNPSCNLIIRWTKTNNK